ncbi:hypothetical protein GETHLI_07800 [Geothrix limicola]|uniref:Major facilitator superfamily (MFS) profile domain-containing protein n=1 Tax=Geothrix limicola TaxID=2927978 RepID=A0ABQ5QC78_9BACT|nr:MFS transporter [Geothrix limicola]GLH72278.1 hypothetical protein GETHLI_07800 [Geothrix limicola]
MSERSQAVTALAMSTLAFTFCFAVWTLNGVLVTFLVENGLFRWDTAQIGWLIGIPVLTGSIMRLPVGLLTDRFGGRKVYTILLLLSALPTWLLGSVHDYQGFLLASLGFGLSGAAFAVGIAYSSVWFSKARQGTALGIFGAGNAGSAITSMGAPLLLKKLTSGGANLEAWRTLPRIYAMVLLVMGVSFFLLTHEKKAEGAKGKSFAQMLTPLRNVRVWRFGLYYFLVFGCFVALAQWLIPYYVGVYGMSLVMAGLLASLFSLPSGLIRAAGGWMSDRFGARTVMYWTFGLSIFACAALMVPRMSIESPGPSVLAQFGGVVTEVHPGHITVGETTYPLRTKAAEPELRNEQMLVLPQSRFWQSPVVKVGDRVKKKQLLASGTTHVFFQANVWIFTFLVFLVGIVWGIGKAAVYRYIPDYFPDEVGVVGGIVGVIGGLGGFAGPILFGYLLRATGLWTTMWVFLMGLSAVCLIWLHTVVRRITREQNETFFTRFEHHAPAISPDDAVEPA